ncbi:efflux RND transporter periplasmic adaptor subunit [Vibrio sp. E150_011]|uniref:efflux RND transporter periplasmic adaptor subunit n=1 Tax=Vibrio sp. 10N.261.51.F12 TaxID=3229679 RepID=UPI00354CF942
MNHWLRISTITAIVIGVTASGVWLTYPEMFSSSTTNTTSYRTESSSIGDISNTVSATGTLAAVDDVVVGAQLSGQVIKVYADFNDVIEKDQLLAKIDPASFAAQVAQAKALSEKSAADATAQQLQIQRARLNYERSVREVERAHVLYLKKNVSEDALDDLQTTSKQYRLDWQQSIVQLEILQATHAANLASLEQAQIELDRTNIRAPISGFVINRNIEAGQTVASSYNTPELFTLAKSLTEMEIEAYIDESDIGLIVEGQKVSFGVDAFADRSFKGEVKQIRKAPQTNSNVVSYVVVISTSNPSGVLLPGMTANLEVAIEKMDGVQRITNAAIRMANRYTVSDSNEAKGPLSRLKYLNLTKEQTLAIQQALPKKAPDASPDADRQRRQQFNKALAGVLTKEQRSLQKQIRNGQVKMGPVLVLRDNKMETIYAELGVSDDTFTAVINPDLSNETIVTQYRESNQ